MNRITRGALSAGALTLTALLTIGAGVPAAVAAPAADEQAGAVALSSATASASAPATASAVGSLPSQSQLHQQSQLPGQSESQAGSQSQDTLDQEPATDAESTGIVLIETEMGYESAAAAGTGILLDDEGTILTNNHVIADSTSISVTVADTGQTYEATVVGSDSTQDVAVLTIDPDEAGSGSTSSAALEPADISTDDVQVGDAVTAVGNSGGAGELQAADGTVTALDASVTTAAEGSAESESLSGMIEIDADIVSGDSGGALLDEDGDVVGVNTAASQGSADITGFAIPIDEALDTAQDIVDGVQTETNTLGYPAFLGVALSSTQQSVPADGSTFRQRGSGWSWESGTGSGAGAAPGSGAGAGQSEAGPGTWSGSGAGSGAGTESDAGTGSQTDPTTGSGATTASGAVSGAVVGGVYEDTPAAQAGLAEGDTITAVDDTAVADASQLADVLGQRAPGDQVELTWIDGSGNTHTAAITLAEGPAA